MPHYLTKGLASFALLFCSFCSTAQTFTGTPTTSPGGPYCAGAAITVNWSITGSFNPANSFQVQLSNNAGSFAAPTVLGTLTNSTNGTSLAVVLPLTAAQGTNYRVRVVSTSPALTSNQSGTFTINAFALGTPTVSGAPVCAGSSITINYTVSNGCDFPNTPTSNTFTAQLSNAAGSFASPTALTTVTSNTSGSIVATIPEGTPAGTNYRVRVVSSNPSGSPVTSAQSATFTVNSFSFGTPTVTGAPVCAGSSITVNYTVLNGCDFPNTPAANTFTVRLSNAAGSFASPTTLTTVTSNTSGAIVATIPESTPAGTNYRVQVVSSNPSGSPVTSAQSATFTINSFGLGTPTVSGGTICQGSTVTITYAITNGCNFPDAPSANTFTARLSDASGSFASPTVLSSVTSNTSGTITATIPIGTPAGTGYRVQVLSSNPSGSPVTSAQSAAFTVTAVGINAPTPALTTFCQGASFNVNYTITSGSCPFQSGNTFTAELSDASGSFASPTVISSAVAATTSGAIPVTIPTTMPAGTGYRIRITSSNPVRTSAVNTANLTINALGIQAPTVSATTLCQNNTLNVTYTVANSCSFPNTPTSNTFSVQLSDAAGSFAFPTTIGTLTSATSGTISATIPSGTPAGTGYRVRVFSNNPGSGIVSPDNGVNITVEAGAGDPTVFGNGVWNAYVYNTATLTNYIGFYTETQLSFASANRFATNLSPTAANTVSGNAYQGCTNSNPNVWSISYKRTNFTCGYYQIDFPTHDDNLNLLIDGVSVFTAPCCASNLNNVWRGFLGPTSTVEITIGNTGGNGNVSVTFTSLPSPVTASPAVTICSGANTVLSASAPVALNYAWTPLGALTPADGLGSAVVAAPTTTTLYTVTGTDPTTGCTAQATVPVTVSSTFTTAVATSLSTICSGINTATLTASGANTYTWSPTTGLSAASGYEVTANPPSTTTYTVTGSNGCTTTTANVTVNVQTIPVTPPTTEFGNGVWNVYAYNSTALTNYYGYYTENNLSFNTTTRWAGGSGPTVANASTGLAYSGCSFGTTNYTLSFKRTNIPCGYYQVDVSHQDDFLAILVDGVLVFQRNAYTPTLQTNVWSGFLGPNSEVELRLVNNSGPGRLDITFGISPNPPLTVPPGVVVCSGSNASLAALSTVVGATYSWTNSGGNTNLIANPNSQNTDAGPLTADEVYTVVLTDAAVTGCTISKTIPVTIDPLANTSVTPTSATTTCPGTNYTLTATGANTYNWTANPPGATAGLSASTGFQVTVAPTVTTTFTVSGSNNCNTLDATSTITVVPLPDINTFPTDRWNVYGFNSTTVGTNYAGFYTELGTGASGYNFNTTTRWASGAAPSTANATNGQAWQGCTMTASNISLSFKRSGFTCGIYQIDIPTHDDSFTLLVNGVVVAQHIGCCDAHTNMWTGVLSPASQVEIRLTQGGGGSYLSTTFTRITQPATTTVWTGQTSTDWSVASNWCSAVPTQNLDALIPSNGPLNMPNILTGDAEVRDLTINGAQAAGTFTLALPAATVTQSTTGNFSVYRNWANSGTFTASAGTTTLTGSTASTSISGSGTQTFNNFTMSRSTGVTFSGGTTRVSALMTLVSGIITQSATFQMLNGSSVTGASNTAYVDGPVQKIGNAAFVFPVGRGGFYRPIAMGAPGNATDAFTGQYFNSSPNPTYPTSQKDLTGLALVNGGEYWTLNRTVGTSAVPVTLSWGNGTGVVNFPANLRVARWDATLARWRDEGNSGTTGTPSPGTGTVTTLANVTTFSSPVSPFTIGSATWNNPLPVELMDFACSQSQGQVVLKWRTATETNNDYFEVQRSIDGETFAVVGKVDGAGNSEVIKRYEFIDRLPAFGRAYYRLRQVDFDLKYSYSDVCLALSDNPVGTALKSNPVDREATVWSNEVIGSIELIDMTGKPIALSYVKDGNDHTFTTTSLANGMYLLRIVTASGIRTEKMIVKHGFSFE